MNEAVTLSESTKELGRKLDMFPGALDYDEDGRPKPGIYLDVPYDEYRSCKATANSDLLRIEKSPAKYIFEKRNPRPDTPATFFGRALHTLVLEPHKFDDEFVVEPEGAPKRPTRAQLNAKKPSPGVLEAIAWWRQWDSEHGHKAMISNKRDPDKGVWGASDWDRLQGMRDAVMAHPLAGVLLSDGWAEVTVIWQDPATKMLCKARVDWWPNGHNLICDLKSTDDATLGGATYSTAKYGYHHAAAHYLDGMEANGHKDLHFVFIFVEKDPPYQVGLYTVRKDDIRAGLARRNVNLRRMKECVITGDWPALPDEVRQIELSPWQRNATIY